MDIDKITHSTADIVKKIIFSNTFLIDFLKRDLINHSSLARKLLPKIQKENKKATIESISIAIKRLNLEQFSFVSKKLKRAIRNTQITLRDEVCLFCLNKSSSVPESTLFEEDDLFYMNQGANEVTIIIDKKNSNFIKDETILKKKNLSIVSLKSDYRDVEGFVYVFLSKVSTSGINVIDMISTHSQFNFIVREKDALRVFEICQDIKKNI